MQKRERLLKTFRFEPTDRPPLDIMENNIWNSLFRDFSNKYGLQTTEEILDFVDCDTRWLIVARQEFMDDYTADANEMSAEANFDGAHKHLLEDVETPEEIQKLFKPDINELVYPDFRAEREKHPDHALVYCPAWMPIFSGACNAFGMEEAMVKMLTEPELFHAYARIQTDYAISVFKKGFDLGAAEYCDFVWMGDDFCDGRGPMIHPDLWRSMVKPYLAEIVAFLKTSGLKILFHSCGSVRMFIEDFIEMGIDGLLVVQTSAKGMDVSELAKEYGGRIVFWGAVDAQQLLTMATPEQVYDEVMKNCEAFKDCGGYVIANSHHSMPDISLENIEAMCRAAHDLEK